MLFNKVASQFSPPPSPPSPCSSWPASSSSPASSPVIEPLCLDNASDEDQTRRGLPITVTDPLAASYNGKISNIKRLAHSSPTISQKRPRLERKSSFPEVSQVQSPVLDIASCREEAVWENAIEHAFETGKREIELRGQGLTKIPSRVIKDLSKMVILPSLDSLDNMRNNRLSAKSPHPVPGRRNFTRIQTAPASTFAGSVPLASPEMKSAQSSNSVLGSVKHPMTIYLGQNNIAKLPAEMWALHNLTVLSLRHNGITFLPPGVVQLVNLKSLNISYNKLKYVPSELMDMGSLTELFLLPNPFIPDPYARSETTKSTESRSVSQTTYIGSRVPSLTELSLRALLAKPAHSWTPPTQDVKTVLEELYPLPLPAGNMWRPVSAPLSRTLAACVPGSIIVDDKMNRNEHSDNPEEVTGISSCPNPGHRKNIFVHHSEERYTWENMIAKINIGGVAAMLWRGCGHGCLDFLGPPTVQFPHENETEESGDAEEVEEVQDIVLHSVEFTGPLDFDDE